MTHCTPRWLRDLSQSRPDRTGGIRMTGSVPGRHAHDGAHANAKTDARKNGDAAETIAEDGAGS